MNYLIDKNNRVIFSSKSKIECNAINELHKHKAKVVNSSDVDITDKELKRILNLMYRYYRTSGYIDFIVNKNTSKLILTYFDSDPMLNGEPAAPITIEQIQQSITIK